MYPLSNQHSRGELATAPVVAQQQALNTIPRTWTCGTPRSCAQCALCIANEVPNWNVHHSVEEMNQPSLRTHTIWTAGPQQEPGLLELVQHDHRDVNQSRKEAARWCGRAESHQPQRATSRTAAPSGPTVAPTTHILDRHCNLVNLLRLIQLRLLLLLEHHGHVFS